jgi:hypothetical protein
MLICSSGECGEVSGQIIKLVNLRYANKIFAKEENGKIKFSGILYLKMHNLNTQYARSNNFHKYIL